MHIGEYIKYKRQSLGYSQQQFADSLNISKQAVSKWERGTALPDILIISKIAYQLRVEPEQLAKIIWINSNHTNLVYYINIEVKEKKGLSYMIKGYTSNNFFDIVGLFESICNGNDESTIQIMSDYYNYDNRRTFRATLFEAAYYDNEECARESLVIEFRKLDSLVKSQVKEGKFKMPKKHSSSQISPIEYLSKDQEPMPLCLKDHKHGEHINISKLFSSRIVYYPAAGVDGHPIRLFNKAKAAHVFVYADFGRTKEKINCELSNNAFKGYHLYHEQNISVNELLHHSPHYHVTEEEMRFAISGYDMSIQPQESFAILKIYERDEDFSEEHGAQRFAVLYIGADANATYDAIFGNSDISPFACIVGSYMGSGYTSFVKNSLIERIATRTNRYPRYLLCPQKFGWQGYEMLKTVSGTISHDKLFLFKKTTLEN